MEDYVILSNNIKTHQGFMEEMKACLHAAEKHGIVFGQAIEDRTSLIKTAQKYLPKYTVTEAVNADCAIIKQPVIDMFGLPELPDNPDKSKDPDNSDNPDKSKDPDNSDKSDKSETIAEKRKKALEKYLDKINSYGYSAITAHHALYSQKTPTNGTDPADTTLYTAAHNAPVRFLKVLDDSYYPKKRILFECTNLPPTHCGTTEAMLYAFDAFCRLFIDKYDIYMLTNRIAAEYHGLESKYKNILYPDTITGVFHLGYTPVQMHNYESQILLNRHCLKIVQQILDIIMVRSYKQHNLSAEANIDLGVYLSDAITFISNFSKDDYLAYYKDRYSVKDSKKYKVIYVATAPDTTNPADDSPLAAPALPFEDYILIVGNTFKHKVISETIEAIKNTAQNYIIVGTPKQKAIAKNIYGYKSGKLEEALIDRLYKSCKAVIFPSLYEGFGLPVIRGLENGKKVIVYDNALNKELCSSYPQHQKNIIFYKKFEDIPQLAATAAACAPAPTPVPTPANSTTPAPTPVPTPANSTTSTPSDPAGQITSAGQDTPVAHPPGHTWDTAAGQLEELFAEVLTEAVNIEKIKQRDWIYAHINDKSTLRQLGDYKLKTLIKYTLKENIKHRHPALYKLLKS